MEKSELKDLINLFIALMLAVVLSIFLHSYVLATSIVDGESMEPTLEDGERLIFNKLAYSIGEPNRGDVVIIQQPTKNYVKRIIGLPGEIIESKNQTLYINGEEYQQNYLNEEAFFNSWDFGPYFIPEDCYFVMGDNREISKDSRNGLGYIKREEVIGKSEFIIYPFQSWDKIQ